MKPLTFKEEPYAGENPPNEIAHPWMPEPNLTTHQLIGKLGEEASELSRICCRILIQGLAQSDPGTGKPNDRALIEEISDVNALMTMLSNKFFIVADRARIERKVKLKEAWMKEIAP